ncbi:MAG TPA: thioredoxin domain-containing protein [Terriglobales bacterium]|nr:thioredoxin domain-containing protein [Terriglobales bacterium]
MKKKFGLLAVLWIASLAGAQDKATILRPPKGASVAIVIFEDLECPDCARAAPLVEEAARTYKIPVVRHDFPLPMHPWAYDAAVLARFFDTHSRAIGNQFRDTVFAHQLEITKDTLRSFAEKFAAAHKIDLPFVVDPEGTLAALVNADRQRGIQLGLQHTPTLYVVSSKRSGTPFVEVVDRSQLFQLIDTMKKE